MESGVTFVDPAIMPEQRLVIALLRNRGRASMRQSP
ncbi:MAG: hypothetical protein LZF86_110795 [Nitrospira sp.]|nr:MAG: hypothetical protein LZF86_110795 [Nitrospira sp.]